jgi:hypothetical protein
MHHCDVAAALPLWLHHCWAALLSLPSPPAATAATAGTATEPILVPLSLCGCCKIVALLLALTWLASWASLRSSGSRAVDSMSPAFSFRRSRDLVFCFSSSSLKMFKSEVGLGCRECDVEPVLIKSGPTSNTIRHYGYDYEQSVRIDCSLFVLYRSRTVAHSTRDRAPLLQRSM